MRFPSPCDASVAGYAPSQKNAEEEPWPTCSTRSLLADLKQERERAGLSVTEWEAFRLDYAGLVDTLLTERIKQANLLEPRCKAPRELIT